MPLFSKPRRKTSDFVQPVEVILMPREHAIHKWVNDKTTSGAAEVLTDVTVYFNIPVGKQVLITCMCFDLQTGSDNCHFQMVKCAAVAGGGAAVDVSGHVHIFTGAAIVTGVAKERIFHPPILVKYNATSARSISMEIHGNDAAAVVSCGWSGFVEDVT